MSVLRTAHKYVLRVPLANALVAKARVSARLSRSPALRASRAASTVAVPWAATRVGWCVVGVGGGADVAVQAEGGCPPCCCLRSCSSVALQSVPCVLVFAGWCVVEVVTAPDCGWGHGNWAQCIYAHLL